MQSSLVGVVDPLEPEVRLARIVVATEARGNYDRGVDFGARLARTLGLPIHLLSVAATGAADADNPREDRLQEAAGALKHANPELVVTSELVTTQTLPVEMLVSRLEPTDLVVEATSAGNETPGTSFAQAVAHQWGGPVVMLGPNVSSDVSLSGAIAVGLDGSAMAERSLPFALDFSHRLNAPIRVVQVVGSAVVDQVARLAKRGERVSESAYLSDLTRRLEEPTDTSWTIVHNNEPTAGLLSFLRDHDVAFLVMSTHGASGLPRPVLGSTCMETVRTAAVPVVILRPTGSIGALADA